MLNICESVIILTNQTEMWATTTARCDRNFGSWSSNMEQGAGAANGLKM